MYIINIYTKKMDTKKIIVCGGTIGVELWRNEFQAFAALVLYSVIDSIVRLKVLKFSAACIYRVDCQLVVDPNCFDYVLGYLV